MVSSGSEHWTLAGLPQGNTITSAIGDTPSAPIRPTNALGNHTMPYPTTSLHNATQSNTPHHTTPYHTTPPHTKSHRACEHGASAIAAAAAAAVAVLVVSSVDPRRQAWRVFVWLRRQCGVRSAKARPHSCPSLRPRVPPFSGHVQRACLCRNLS